MRFGKATDNLRKALGCGDPGLIEFNGNRLQRSSSTKCGVNIPSFDLSDTAGTAWGIQMTEIGAYKLVYHHSGAPRVWTVVEPSEFRRLEDLVAQILALPDCSRSANDGLLKYEPRCHQSVGHKRLSRSNEGVGASTVEDPGKTLYLSAETLEAESIRFNKFVQYQGEMVILFPFSYYQGYNVGPNVVESMAYASIRWEVFPMADLIRQCNRSCYRGKQPMLVDLTFAKPISKAVGGAIPSIEEALEYYRARFIS